jgi:glutamyl-tRNA synthetase
VKTYFDKAGIIADQSMLHKVIDLVKERCTLLPDFVEQASFFFERPAHYDLELVKTKWNAEKKLFFTAFSEKLNGLDTWDFDSMEKIFKELAAEKNIKPGELLQPLRIMLVGGKFGPPVFTIAGILGKEETIGRIRMVSGLLDD